MAGREENYSNSCLQVGGFFRKGEGYKRLVVPKIKVAAAQLM